MTDNVVIAIIAGCAVVISAICVLGGAIFAYVHTGKNMNKRLDHIEHILEVIQTDIVKWSEQIFKIKAHVKLD